MWKATLFLSSLLIAFNSWAEPATAERIYMSTCIACHGADGAGGMPGVSDLTDPAGSLNKSDQELFDAIRNGISPSPGGIVMPPNGGNQDLTDTEVYGLVHYLRTTFGRTEDVATHTIGDEK